MSNKVKIAENQQGRLNVKLTPDYVVGLVDGEGYFSVSALIDRSAGWNCHNVRMVFGIDLNVIDGKILYNIKDWFGCGNISLKKEKREKFSDQFRFQVRDTKSILKIIIPFFKKHPLKLPKKVKTFQKFVEIAKMKERKEHIGTEGFNKAKLLASQLHT